MVGSQLRGWYGMVPCGGGGGKSVFPVDGDWTLLLVLLKENLGHGNKPVIATGSIPNTGQHWTIDGTLRWD